MRFRTQLAVAALVVSALAVGSLLGGVLGDGGRSAAATAVPVDASFAADRALTGIAAAGGTDTRELERAVRERPDDARSLVLLGYAYQQRWRETADASNLPRSEAALRRASRLDPTDSLAVIGLGSLALIRHDFRAALAIGRRAERLAPSSARTYGLVGDALLELGRYEDAFRAFERMIALRPSVASYARIAYARELLGDLDGARAAMQLAADAASGQREPAAWANVELAKLDLRAGRLPRAERHLRAALELVPGYVFAAEQLARLEAARGNLPRAIRLAQRAADCGAAPAVRLPPRRSPCPQRQPRSGASARCRPSARSTGILAANGVRTDVESAVFDADHRIGAATLVARARAARADRPSILGDDALAWALARTGRCDEARTWSERSLRLGHAGRAPLLPPRPRSSAARATGSLPAAGRARRSRSTRRSPSAGRRSPAASPPDPGRVEPRRRAGRTIARPPPQGGTRMTVRRGGLALGLVLVTAAAIAALSAGRAAPDGANAASHREAPLISLDPAADISDFFLFRSYEPGKSDRARADHERQSGRGAELGAELLRLRPERHLLVRNRQRPRREGGRRPLRRSVRERDPRLHEGPRTAASLHRRRPASGRGRRGRPGQRPAPDVPGDDERHEAARRLAAGAAGQRRPPDDAELRGELPLRGDQDARRRDPGVRRPAGRPVLHRPRRRVRHAQPQSVRA